MTTADPPDDTEPVSQPVEQPHEDDGLDLARQVTRATAGATPAAHRRRRRPDRPTAAVPARQGGLSGAHPDDRDPQLLSSEVARIVEQRGWELDLRVRGVFARWAELVGEEVAAHCTPETFADGVLTARADSTAWATQLRLLAPAVLRRLNGELGEGTVTVVEVLGPHGPTWKHGPRSVRDGRGPRDTYG